MASSPRTFVPCVLVIRVLPTCRCWNIEGALMSYHSFFRKGSTALHAPQRKVSRRPERDHSAHTRICRWHHTHNTSLQFIYGALLLSSALSTLGGKLVLTDSHVCWFASADTRQTRERNVSRVQQAFGAAQGVGKGQDNMPVCDAILPRGSTRRSVCRRSFLTSEPSQSRVSRYTQVSKVGCSSCIDISY